MAKRDFPPLLSVGFHGMQLADVEALCVTGFSSSATRAPIMAGLRAVIERLSADGVEASVWVNGSFLTHKPDPEDSDIVAVIRSEFYDQASAAQKATIAWFAGDLKAQ